MNNQIHGKVTVQTILFYSFVRKFQAFQLTFEDFTEPELTLEGKEKRKERKIK